LPAFARRVEWELTRIGKKAYHWISGGAALAGGMAGIKEMKNMRVGCGTFPGQGPGTGSAHI